MARRRPPNRTSIHPTPASSISRPKKSLGQHFLSNRGILNAIADAAHVGAGDTVVEIGPGLGSLTEVLAARASRVVAVELDGDLAGRLRTRMPANVEVVEADARDVEPESLLNGCTDYKLLGNLPYYAAMPILRHFLEGECKPLTAAVLVQLEVAREICAAPGQMSLMSVSVQLYGQPRLVRLVRPGSFNPPPRVTSAVVGVNVFRQAAEGVDNPTAFFRVVRAGFSAPRKQLRNALAHGLAVTPVDAEALLKTAAIDPRRRAETLAVAEWATLYRQWIVQ
jgi:16S rRNA (adenine1518-N6/adenine1519-N6)-dimethyltransferase